MSNSTVPDLLSYSRLSRLVSEVKSRTTVASAEVVSGRYEDATAAVKGDIGAVHLLKKAVEDARHYQTSLSLAETRASLTQASLKTLTTQTTELSTSALSALDKGEAASLKLYDDQARGALQTIFSALNTSEGGRALFGGDEAGRAPLASLDQLLLDVQAIMAAGPDAASVDTALDVYFDDPAGGFQTTIYQGGAGDAPSVELAPGVRVAASVKADAQPLKDLIRGLAVIANYETPPAGSPAERDAVVRDGVLLTLKAENDITDMRAQLGIAESQISNAKSRYAEAETLYTTLYNEKTARDPYEAAAELQQLEAQLESSYLVTARLSRLTLANYLD